MACHLLGPDDSPFGDLPLRTEPGDSEVALGDMGWGRRRATVDPRLASCAVLIGAELNAKMEHQTARDTTTGIALPMGMRGATMADTVA